MSARAVPTAHPLRVDGALAALLAAAVAATTLTQPTAPVVLLLVATSALAWRRVHPTESAAVVAGSVLAAWASTVSGTSDGQERVFVEGGALLALSVVSAVGSGPRWLAWAALPSSVAVAILAGALLGGVALTPALGAAVGLALLAWTVGQWRRSQHSYQASLLERAEQAETEREQRAQLVVARERADLARELHDVVAHSLAVMTAQADGARFVLQASPEAAATALSTVAETGRSAMLDMQGLLDVLTGGAAAHGSPLAPQPRLADLPDLVEAVRSGGVSVAVHELGNPERLSAGAELAVFRLVQEALTNVIKHAGAGTAAVVTLTWSEHELRVVVCDDGAGSAPAGGGSGRGLAGMRHRVEQVGGAASAGPRPEGGFEVRARVPAVSAVADR